MKTLVLKVNQLGDNVVFLPVIQELAHRFGTEQLHVLTSPAAAILYEGLLPADRVRAIPTSTFNGAWKRPALLLDVIRTVRGVRPDLVLVPFDQGNVSRLLALVSGAAVRVGISSPRVRTNRFLNHPLKPDYSSAMAAQDWSLLLHSATVVDGLENLPAAPPAPDLRHLLVDGSTADPRRILVHPGASRDYKKWPLDRFVALANHLTGEGFSVSWCRQDGTGESALAPSVQILPPGDLKSFIRHLACCGLFVGNNSGPMNLANALGLPAVIFSGPSPPKWDPFWHRERTVNLRLPDLACQPCDAVTGPVNKCLNKTEPMACMRRWSVEQVTGQVRDLWNQSYPTGSVN